jgi:hypothetical protein
MFSFIFLYRGGRSVIVNGDRDIRRRRSAHVVIIQIISLAVLVSLVANRRNWTKPRHSGVAHDA